MKLRSPAFIIFTLGISFLALTALVAPLARSQAAPSSPSPLQATAVSSSLIDLSWQDTANENGFLVYRSTSASLSNATIFQAAANAVSYSDNGLEPASTYYYQVYACNDAGCTSSNVANTATSNAPPAVNTSVGGGSDVTAGAIDAPGGFSVTAISSCAFKASWNPVTGANAYDAERNGFTEPSIATIDEGGKKTFTDKDNDALWKAEDEVDHIAPGKAYSYRVRAKNTVTGGLSEPSETVSVSALALPPKPGAPKDITASFNATTGNVELQWTMNAPASTLFPSFGGFEIWRAVSVNDGNSFGPLQRLDRIPSTIVKEGKFYYNDNRSVSTAASYRYVLKSQETGGDGCNPLRAEHAIVSDNSPAVTLPAAPDNLSVNFQENPRRITLNWRDNSKGDANEARFEVLRSTSESFSPVTSNYVRTTESGQSRFEDNEIEAAGTATYWYKVRACTATACSAYSPAVGESTGLPAPYALTVAPSSVGATTVGVSLSWKIDLRLSGTEFWVRRREAGGASYTQKPVNVNNCGSMPNTCVDTVERGKRYEYDIRATRQDASVFSETVIFDANLSAIRGWAWSGNGLGWIRLSHNSSSTSWGPATAPAENIPYGVFIDSVGNLSGYAWSPYVGWLSFGLTGGDVTNCPDAQELVSVGSDCRGRIDFTTDNVTGWAKFLRDANGNGIGEFVSLSQKSGEPPYRLVYATTTIEGVGELRGFAWGGSKMGWLSFGGPILRSITPNPGGTSVTVEWENPIAYSKIWIQALEKTATARLEDKDAYETRAVIDRDGSLTQGVGKSATITDLKPNTEYAFFVKGFPK